MAESWVMLKSSSEYLIPPTRVADTQPFQAQANATFSIDRDVVDYATYGKARHDTQVLKTSRFAFGKSDSTHKTAQTSTFSSRTLLGPVKDFDASQSHVGIWALEEQVFSYALFEAMGGADDVNLGKDGSNGTRSSRWEQK
ncbi:uncharacterized protein UV8b_03880 [Ustilaginoidea virens]|uniref:Uncharacterized protein n=1 Tax=Ustilaginoidea virens TaxID=1159556 RepID=A0A8E5HQ66_USTVR|nr:uncharacterized protein UV8b_03880 [Ustilaginoidea virens]QUC19639.1 hypothetical protein UV8b_03880 [Ustilaginoidea virens]